MTLTPACGEKPLPSRSMTRMLQELTLPTIRQGRKDARLTFLYKISQGLVPGIPSENYLIHQKVKRIIKEKNQGLCSK